MKRPIRKGRGAKAGGSEDGRAARTRASRLIDGRIEELGGWRGGVLARVRALIREADPEVVEEWKWRGTPVWSHDGIVCTGEAYQKVVKLTFARGAALQDPDRLFNASLGGNVRRAIDIREGEKLREPAFKRLVKAAVAKNSLKPAPRTSRRSALGTSARPRSGGSSGSG